MFVTITVPALKIHINCLVVIVKRKKIYREVSYTRCYLFKQSMANYDVISFNVNCSVSLLSLL